MRRRAHVVLEAMLASSADARTRPTQARRGPRRREAPGWGRAADLHGLPLYTFPEEGAGKLDGDGIADDFQGTHSEWKAARASGSSGSRPPGDKDPAERRLLTRRSKLAPPAPVAQLDRAADF